MFDEEQAADMCLAIPARVVELRDGDQALIDLGGVRKEISLALVEDVWPGDYVIVHVGYALQKVDPEEARKTLELFAGLAAVGGRGVKYVDEFRDGALARKIAARIAAIADPVAHLPFHGVLRRPHARHLALRRDGPAARATS